MISITQLSPDNAFYPIVPPISLELTSRCNLKCPYCSNSQLDRPPEVIDWALLEKIVDECSDGHHNIAALHGTGEPLLWERLEDVIRLVREAGAGSGSFATNGTLLTAARAQRLLDTGLNAIRISLDSLDEGIYAATRGGKLQDVINNIKGLIALAPSNFLITIILMRHKAQAIENEQVANFYRTFGFHQNVELEIVENGLMVSSPEDFREHPIKVRQCTRPREWLAITHEGKVSVCCSDQNALGVLGDVRYQSIDEIWYSMETQKTLANIALGQGQCPDVCTQHCWLEEPQTDGTAKVDECYELPFATGLEQLEQSIQEGNFTRGLEILAALETRHPTHKQLAYFSEVLNQAKHGFAKTTQPNELLRKITQLSEDVTSKDQLIQKHHDFAQQLLEELEKRRIKVATQWEL